MNEGTSDPGRWDGRPATTVHQLGELAELLGLLSSEPPPRGEGDLEGDTDPGAPHGIGTDTDR